MVLMMKMRGDNDDVQHDVKDDPIVDSRRRLEHNIMSSITGSRHNCEQGQAKPQLGGCTAHHNNETTERGGEAHHRRGGAGGGITWGGGGGGGLRQPCIIYVTLSLSIPWLLIIGLRNSAPPHPGAENMVNLGQQPCSSYSLNAQPQTQLPGTGVADAKRAQRKEKEALKPKPKV